MSCTDKSWPGPDCTQPRTQGAIQLNCVGRHLGVTAPEMDEVFDQIEAKIARGDTSVCDYYNRGELRFDDRLVKRWDAVEKKCAKLSQLEDDVNQVSEALFAAEHDAFCPIAEASEYDCAESELEMVSAPADEVAFM